MWTFLYGALQLVFWIAGRVEDTRTKKIKKSDLEIREELGKAEEAGTVVAASEEEKRINARGGES